MEPLPLNIPHYPMLRWVVRHGGWLSAAVPLVVVALATAASALMGDILYLVAGVGIGLVQFVVLRTLVELVCLITDMLLPK